MKKVYEIKETFSKIEKWDEVKPSDIEKRILENLKNGYMVCWLCNEVLFGRVREGKIEFYHELQSDFPKYLLRIRAFNSQKEIHIWKSQGQFKGRIREDKDIEAGDGETLKKVEYIEAHQIMYGNGKNVRKINEEFYEIYDSRGIKYILPSELIRENILSKDSYFVLVTRNYIDYNEIGQAGFIDSRFVKIEHKEGES
ncbi:hypothetical protein Csac_0488 [Caldicellulosiruptor saccharolyticus DSM 8903]|uniref:CRISPR-associated protein, TIGR03984 family n=1 Tax=Caldicellulosiruptor saccharolyticus (strain ATCC 43494 / DSM 8903 / Tp8T 6331) TaxID=351627 RepID=A4XGU0_CALS8|nr:CRISPR-associated protein Csx19 [Caldicellulosiruptor saccharolyticus]ABP66125.1 hypothetical protein Csac_0488 [Caldicellulosiruptor saccharolyticus DSM 8903]